MSAGAGMPKLKIGHARIQADLENRGQEIAEAYYAKRHLDGPGIIKSAELLHEFWTRDKKNIKMHAIADGFRRQAYIIAQTRAGA